MVCVIREDGRESRSVALDGPCAAATLALGHLSSFRPGCVSAIAIRQPRTWSHFFLP